MGKKESVMQVSIFQEANPASLASLLPYTNIKKMKKGEHVFLDRARLQNIYFLLAGSVCFYKIGVNEEKKVIQIAKKGDVLNAVTLDGNRTSYFCECMSNVSVVTINKERLLFAAQHDFSLMMALFSSVTQDMRRLHHQMQNYVSAIRIDKRIAAKLWKLGKDYGVEVKQGTKISISVSITFLADLIGAKRETVSRQVKILCDKKLITLQGKHFIILDAHKLRQYVYLP